MGLFPCVFAYDNRMVTGECLFVFQGRDGGWGCWEAFWSRQGFAECCLDPFTCLCLDEQTGLMIMSGILPLHWYANWLAWRMFENMLRVVSYIFLIFIAKWLWWQVLSKEVGRACSVREPIDSKVNFHQLTQRWILWWIFINSHIVVIFNFSPPPHYHTWISEKVSLICVTLEMQSPGGLPPLGNVIRPWPPSDII